jgi:hypothetical protein
MVVYILFVLEPSLLQTRRIYNDNCASKPIHPDGLAARLPFNIVDQQLALDQIHLQQCLGENIRKFNSAWEDFETSLKIFDNEVDELNQRLRAKQVKEINQKAQVKEERKRPALKLPDKVREKKTKV